MNTKQLECFLATAKTLSFTRAARELYMAQPTVAYQISQLETELGFPLFERESRGLSITEGGKAFLQGANDLLQKMNTVIRQAENAHRKKNCTINIRNHTYIHDAVFAKAIDAFLDCHPEVDISVRLLTFPFSEKGFERTDVRIFSEQKAYVSPTNEKIYELNTIVTHGIMRKRHGLGAKKSLTMEDVQPYPLVIFDRMLMDRMQLWYWERIQKNPSRYRVEEHQFESFEELQLNMLSHDGILLSRGTYVNLLPGLVQIPFSEGTVLHNSIAYREDPEKPILREFVGFLLDYYREHWVVEGLEALEKRI